MRTQAPRCDHTASWQRLQSHAQQQANMPALTELFKQDPQRFEHFSAQAGAILADYSKQHITHEICQDLITLARECALEAKRDTMLEGQPINTTENRQVLHTALRNTQPHVLYHKEVQASLSQFLGYAEHIRENPVITDIVSIGIGGSDLGPRMATQALAPFTHPGKRYHFVSNVDGFELTSVLQHLQPQSTLFIVVSKTFTTQETLANAHTAKAWFKEGSQAKLAKHFVGVTTNIDAAKAFGIAQTFAFWDWVGGRYSIWSAVSLALAIAIGEENFRHFLHGAQSIDEHFAQAPLESNVPILLSLVDIWNRSFLNRPTRCIAPYHQGLARFPAYLQQLEMESNGKSVDIAGRAVTYPTSATVWGEAGTNGQHAFFQMLHQGTDVIPVDFILVHKAIYPKHCIAQPVQSALKKQHALLLANGLAQSRALMVGKTYDEALAENIQPATRTHAGAGTHTSANMDAEILAKHRTFAGNRPSTTLLVEDLTPHNLGALIALHEHRTFCCGAIWNLNSFDQWGVELGKTLATGLLPRFETGNVQGLDGSSAHLLKRLSS